MPKIIPTDKARQAGRGRPVLIVLIVGLLLAMGVWAGVELWGRQIAPPATGSAEGVVGALSAARYTAATARPWRESRS